MGQGQPTIIWFERDLRVNDNPALAWAAERKRPVEALFVLPFSDSVDDGSLGAASRWWLHHALESLRHELRGLGVRLTLRRGPVLDVLRAVRAECGADAVAWNRRYEPAAIERDRTIARALRGDGALVETFTSSLLLEPWQLKNGSGQPYRVFTPFWNAVRARFKPGASCAVPNALNAGARQALHSLTLGEFELLPRVPWDGSLYARWQPSEAAGLELLTTFERSGAANYATRRDQLAITGTSRLSPYLHFGQLSPRQVWRALENAGAESYLRQLGWREFAAHLLVHFPHTADRPFRPEFAAFPWRDDRELFARWQEGATGYPVVDAAMRELWQTGWMHNRARMIAASFLVKDLLQPWQRGAQWFWDTLVDADLANNTLGWQWVAGCGADAAPYFRIFNPVTQGEKFDPEGAYVRRWVPELAALPTKFIHAPWHADEVTLLRAGVKLGTTYPRPCVDHAEARTAALAAYRHIQGRFAA